MCLCLCVCVCACSLCDLPCESALIDHADTKAHKRCLCLCCTRLRNYFAPVTLPDGQVQVGQTQEHQLNNLEAFSKLVNNDQHSYYDVVNGYVMSSAERLERLKEHLVHTTDRLDEYLGAIRAGVHANVPVSSEGMAC